MLWSWFETFKVSEREKNEKTGSKSSFSFCWWRVFLRRKFIEKCIKGRKSFDVRFKLSQITPDLLHQKNVYEGKEWIRKNFPTNAFKLSLSKQCTFKLKYCPNISRSLLGWMMWEKELKSNRNKKKTNKHKNVSEEFEIKLAKSDGERKFYINNSLLFTSGTAIFSASDVASDSDEISVYMCTLYGEDMITYSV